MERPRSTPTASAERAERGAGRGARAGARRRRGSRSSADPSCSPVLREAGVVDAGGYALTVIFAGVVAALRGDRAARARAPRAGRVTHPEHESSTYRYCTNFAVTGAGPRAARFVAGARGARRLGARRRRRGDAEGARPHRRPGRGDGGLRRRRRGLAPRRRRHARAGRRARPAPGAPTAVPRRRQPAARWPWSRAPAYATCSSRSARVTVDGGPTLNPSTYDLLAGIHAVAAEEVVVLPEQPERDHGRRARRRAVGQGGRGRPDALPAGRARRGRGAQPRRARRGERARRCGALERVRTGGVAPRRARRRQGPLRGRRRGRASSRSELVAWGDPGATLRASLESLADGRRARHRASRATTRRSTASRPALAPAASSSSCDEGGQPALVVAASAPSRTGRACHRSARRMPPRHCRPPSPAREPLDAPSCARLRCARRAVPARRCGSPARRRAAEGGRALGLDTVGDLLEHLPRDRREARTIAELAPGESATVVVEVRSITAAAGAPPRHAAAGRGRRRPTAAG